MTDDTPPFVFESEYVGALMDTGKRCLALSQEHKELTGYNRFGAGLHDQVGNEPLENASAFAQRVLESDPEAWASVLRSSLVMVQGAENDTVLAQRLEHLAAVTIHWLTDVRNRTTTGADR